MTKSLAQTIIFGRDDDVAKALSTRPKINEIDEYGYTPLIQGAIVNSVNKSRLLLQAGAKIDFPDLTGRTALHWAASNGNRALCELLLNNGADPNSYSYAAQPALVIPYLKQNKSIYQHLFNKGADLNFAEDFINAKLLGHRFELEGRVDIVDTKNTFIEVEFEGFYLEFSLNLVASSLVDFRTNFGSKNLRKYFAKLDATINALHNAIELIKYQHYLIDIGKFRQKIDTLLDHEPLVLPIAFDGHAVTFIKFWEWLIRCDRGEFGRRSGTTIVYFMRNPQMLNKAFLRELLYKRQYAEGINNQLVDYLGLDVAWRLPLSPQTIGNCTWANVEAVIPALLFLFALEERGGKEPELCQKEALEFYNNWLEWDQNRALHFCVESFRDASAARKAAKAALMASIMFQTCKYENPKDHERVAKILPILTLPKYRYILDSYIKVFSGEQKSDLIKNLYNFLDDFGVVV